MSLSHEYKQQLAWRHWAQVMDLLPPLAGKTVLDLGCAIGDQAALLVERGARVVGVDGNPELIATARARGVPNTEFRHGYLQTLDGVEAADGIWCSFAAAYFPDFSPALACWKEHLKPRGWIALTELDNIFGHEPVEAGTRALLDEYMASAFTAKRHDFFMGRKLRANLESAGFAILSSGTIGDEELAFEGPARPEVIEGWRARLDRMKLLQEQCGARFESVRGDFLAALSRPDHRSLAKVHYCIARKHGDEEV
jgi:SAM-dependent methyltransferase